MSAPSRWGVVADDLTGAADVAAEAAELVGVARLLLGRDPVIGEVPAGSVSVLVSQARALPAAQAQQTTAAAAQRLLSAGVDRLFLKVDSTLRGSVAAQVRGALDAWRSRAPEAVAVLCPAYPQQGRTVDRGVVRVRGVPVAESAAGADPVTPLRESSVLGIVPDAVPWSEGWRAAADSRGILACDASTDADLAAVAAAIDERDADALPVGSAGLAHALVNRWRGEELAVLPPRVKQCLVVISSMHPSTRAQLARLRSTDMRGADVLTTGTAPVDPDDAARLLAEEVADRLRTTRDVALVLVGGDGAAAVLERFGAHALDVRGLLAPGSPWGSVVGGAADGALVITKSGGFGDEDALVTILDRLRAGQTNEGTS